MKDRLGVAENEVQQTKEQYGGEGAARSERCDGGEVKTAVA